MEQSHFSEIITERLVLRKLQSADWKMISYLRSDKEVNKHVKRPSAETKAKALEFISKINNGIENQENYYWTITEKHNSEMIGSICLWNFSRDRKSAEVGYDLRPKFQGNGIMNESLKSILEFGFIKLDLELIEAYTHQENEPSKRLLKKNDFKLVPGKKDQHNENNLIYEIKGH